MSRIRAVLFVLLCVVFGTCAAQEGQSTPASPGRQVLVMLHAASPHFRPDAAYGGAYDAAVGRAAQLRVAQRLAGEYELTIVSSWPMPALGVDCFVMEAHGGASLEQAVARLAADPRVESAQSMNVFSVLAHGDPLYRLQPSARLWDLEDVHKMATGKHVRVAIVDTGVETDHPDLVGRVALASNLVDGRVDVAELHGTAVAGIIGARADDGVGIAGIAPDSTLFALRACWQEGPGVAAVCTTFTLAKALQLALDERVDVINLSVGGPRDRLLERLIDVASSRGVIVVSAADWTAGKMSFPASHRGVLAVAEVEGQDASFTALFAPGRDIPAPVPGKQWGFVSGSSFAAAHVTGLVALLRELAPNVQPKQVREALAPKTAANVAGGRRPMVDACAAIAAIGG
ncbi:MAG TPA: S8 family serine peptidase, partial [Casimicrobiaceae bacterium]|nr:S8 family serine peptidase [Casimicrobiaceae bacterium]